MVYQYQRAVWICLRACSKNVGRVHTVFYSTSSRVGCQCKHPHLCCKVEHLKMEFYKDCLLWNCTCALNIILSKLQEKVFFPTLHLYQHFLHFSWFTELLVCYKISPPKRSHFSPVVLLLCTTAWCSFAPHVEKRCVKATTTSSNYHTLKNIQLCITNEHLQPSPTPSAFSSLSSSSL